ncbi:nucleotidyl transferase AbiEii/AbiGii toxin family protein [Alcaligenaceae bacterium]|nr:nucleotidyl transferase AbiEii/AbiGii toxin family protein [Alcaligenaceae bacterium]
MIPQRNISMISNTLVTAGGRRIPEAVIERDYVLAWFLTGLAGHPLREILAFKGGTALRRCWFEDYRFSEDLDFTLISPITLEDILTGFDEIFAAIESEAAALSGLNLSDYVRRRLTAANTLAEELDALRQAVRHLSQISETRAAALETAFLVRATARPEHIAIAQAAMRRRGIAHLSD